MESLNSKKNKLTDTRNLIRLLTVFLFLPWFGGLAHAIFGIEFEFESEIVVLSSFFILGSFWCGWLCPFGNLSFFVSKISDKLFPSVKLKIPAKLDKVLRYLKFLFLGLFIFTLISSGIDYFFGDHMDMYFANDYTKAYIKFKKYAIILVPLVIPRFFCKYICFQKAAYNIINRIFPIIKISRNTDTCINCLKCDKVCPMDINVSKEKTISGMDCIGCYECVNDGVCPPKADAIHLKFLNKKINPYVFAMIAIVIYYLITLIVLNI